MRRILLSISVVVLAACGGGGGTGPVSTGQFINSPAKGVNYRTSSGLSGVTDANGNFEFRAGDSVSFSLNLGNGNSLSLGSATGGTAVSVLSLSGSGIDPLAVSQVLQTLDKSNVSGSMDLTELVLPSNVVQNIQSALVSSAAANAVIGTIATSVHTALPNREQKNPEGVTTLEALNTLAQQPANQSAVRTRIKQGVGGGLLSQVEDKPAFTVTTLTQGNQTRTLVEFFLLKSTSPGVGDFFADGEKKPDSLHGNRAGSYTYQSGSSTGDWENWDDDGKGEFIVRGVDLANRRFVLEYQNDDYQESGSMTGSFLLALQTSGLVRKVLTVRKACNNGTDAILTFANAAEANGFDVAYTSNCLGNGLFKPLTSPSVFNGYVLQVTDGTKTRRMGLISHRDYDGERTSDSSNNFGIDPAGGSGRFVVLPEDRDDRDDKPQFFDFSYVPRT
jgi:hypothetical protein